MSEKPQKRLVGWSQYLQMIGEKGIYYFLGAFCGGCGLCFLVCFVLLVYAFFSVAHLGGLAYLLLCIVGGGFAGLGVGALYCGKTLFSGGKSMEPVTPITRHNTGDLPEVETLVRAFDSTTIDPRRELLRAGGQGPETPAEELLRAGQENRQD
jgi:hypothetical protein